MAEFRKWNDLESFANVVKSMNYRKYSGYLETLGNKLEYYGKIKLHGTNAAVQITNDGKVLAQKRSSILGEGQDNFGFKTWVMEHEEFFKSVISGSTDNYVIYGEWAGPGIQDGVAVSQTKNKMFYVFAVDIWNDLEIQRIIEPKEIESVLGPNMPDRMLVLPWHCRIELDFMDKDKLQASIDNLNKEVEAIGKSDPFMLDNFEIDGPGEGLVLYPTLSEFGFYHNDELEYASIFQFKAKSEEHRVNKTKVAVAVDPEKIATSKRFCAMFCTDQRMEQAFTEAVAREKDPKLTGAFIKWVCQDVYKESELERDALPVEWNALSKAVASQAAVWYKARCQEV